MAIVGTKRAAVPVEGTGPGSEVPSVAGWSDSSLRESGRHQVKSHRDRPSCPGRQRGRIIPQRREPISSTQAHGIAAPSTDEARQSPMTPTAEELHARTSEGQ